jgi:hypothetical protein
LEASRKLFKLVLWIDRDSVKKNSTDKLGPEDADIVVDNNGSIKDLEENLRMILIRELTE